jgi:hypothetical protein
MTILLVIALILAVIAWGAYQSRDDRWMVALRNWGSRNAPDKRKPKKGKGSL